jgi:S-phase kinase-associated protein 1
MSQLVKETLGDDDDDDDGDLDNDKNPDIPLPNVSADVLAKVIEYCLHYQQDEMRTIQTPLKSSKLDELVQEWYAEFVQVDKNLLFDLVAAANFMDIKPLLDLTCLAVSIMIKGKSATELRHMFNISNDYSAEEQAQIARDNNRWIEQPPPPTAGGNLDK